MPLHPTLLSLDPVTNTQSRRLLLLILGLGLLVRLIFLYATQDTGLMIVDEQHYQTLAVNLLQGNGFAWESGNLTSIRPPLYPAFLALIWKITGTESAIVIRIAQILFALGNVYLIHRLGILLFDHRVALVAAAGLAFYPSILGFNTFILTEVLFTFILTLTVLGVATLIKTPSSWLAWSTGVALGLAALTRSVLWPFPLVLCPFVFFVTPGSKQRRFRLAGLLLIGYGLVVSPWAIRNTQLQGVFTMVDTMGGITLRMGNYEHTPLNRAWDPMTLQGDNSIFQELRTEHPDVFTWTEGQKEKWALRKALIFMLHHPGLTFQRGLIKFANFWGLERTIIAGWQQRMYQPPSWFAALGTVVIPMAYVVVMVFVCVGIFLSPPEDRRMHVLLLLVIGFVAGIHTLAFGHERYHLPLIPFILLYAAAAVTHKAWQQVRLGLRFDAAPLAVFALLLVIWGREVLIVDADRIQSLLLILFS
jgi:4-amino-4-deoxy-L-arabinose transferase-like glycosyltransferase